VTFTVTKSWFLKASFFLFSPTCELFAFRFVSKTLSWAPQLTKTSLLLWFSSGASIPDILFFVFCSLIFPHFCVTDHSRDMGFFSPYTTLGGVMVLSLLHGSCWCACS
jgi:hypothetical protein